MAVTVTEILVKNYCQKFRKGPKALEKFMKIFQFMKTKDHIMSIFQIYRQKWTLGKKKLLIQMKNFGKKA